MKQLYDIVEGAGHAAMRLGAGSTGVAYDLGNGWVRKTLKVPCRYNEAGVDHKVVDRWAKVRKGLTVIPYIKNWDGDNYDIEKFETPCPEGQLIVKAVDKYLFTCRPEDWKPERVEKLKNEFGEDAEWIMQWLKDLCHDGDLIIGHTRWGDDIRPSNIGKDKHGNVKIFDWCNVYVGRI